jgi:hypothetical protein
MVDLTPVAISLLRPLADRCICNGINSKRVRTLSGEARQPAFAAFLCTTGLTKPAARFARAGRPTRVPFQAGVLFTARQTYPTARIAHAIRATAVTLPARIAIAAGSIGETARVARTIRATDVPLLARVALATGEISEAAQVAQAVRAADEPFLARIVLAARLTIPATLVAHAVRTTDVPFPARVALTAETVIPATLVARTVRATHVSFLARVTRAAELITPATLVASAIGTADQIIPGAGVSLKTTTILVPGLRPTAHEQSKNDHSDQYPAHLSTPLGLWTDRRRHTMHTNQIAGQDVRQPARSRRASTPQTRCRTTKASTRRTSAVGGPRGTMVVAKPLAASINPVART